MTANRSEEKKKKRIISFSKEDYQRAKKGEVYIARIKLGTVKLVDTQAAVAVFLWEQTYNQTSHSNSFVTNV